ncbi:hypothetical protein LZ30DRAFT_181316 [Colletotrichum cereale]|nr:hypothetical protein LZ30DRAFT_181316 [Colletotrichum cereale]
MSTETRIHSSRVQRVDQAINLETSTCRRRFVWPQSLQARLSPVGRGTVEESRCKPTLTCRVGIESRVFVPVEPGCEGFVRTDIQVDVLRILSGSGGMNKRVSGSAGRQTSGNMDDRRTLGECEETAPWHAVCWLVRGSGLGTEAGGGRIMQRKDVTGGTCKEGTDCVPNAHQEGASNWRLHGVVS